MAANDTKGFDYVRPGGEPANGMAGADASGFDYCFAGGEPFGWIVAQPAAPAGGSLLLRLQTECLFVGAFY